MSSQEYSKEIQLEIFDEIIKNQGTDEIVDVTNPVRQWNYDFLLTQGYIKQDFSSSNVFTDPKVSGMLMGETITESGKARRLDMYDMLQREHEQMQRHKTTDKK